VKASNEAASDSTPKPVDPSAVKTVTWDGKSTYTCGASDNVKIEKVTAKIASGTAIEALGSCHLTLVNCDITAPTAINAMGSANVTVQGGSVNGSVNSAVAMGAATIDFKGTTVKGPTQGKVTGAK
jgi:hypothetical protein